MSLFRGDEPREEELAALADGSLAEERREVLEGQVAASPELAARLAEQQRALALVRGAVQDVEAPAGLRARVEAQRRGRRLRRRPLVLAAGFATAVAAVLVLVLTLPGGAGGPSLAQAASLATRPAVAAAPQPDPDNAKLLNRDVQGVAFPTWLEEFGWRAVGVRDDEIAGRPATTVFYEKNGKRIGYTVVSGKGLHVPGDAAAATRNGVDLNVLSIGGREVVTWMRLGHTCVLSGVDVDRDVLLKLAAWKGDGAVDF